VHTEGEVSAKEGGHDCSHQGYRRKGGPVRVTKEDVRRILDTRKTFLLSSRTRSRSRVLLVRSEPFTLQDRGTDSRRSIFGVPMRNVTKSEFWCRLAQYHLKSEFGGAPDLFCGAGGLLRAVYHYAEPRALTNRERARLLTTSSSKAQQGPCAARSAWRFRRVRQRLPLRPPIRRVHPFVDTAAAWAPVGIMRILWEVVEL